MPILRPKTLRIALILSATSVVVDKALFTARLGEWLEARIKVLGKLSISGNNNPTLYLVIDWCQHLLESRKSAKMFQRANLERS
jgi:hypothetical protein